MKNKKLIGINTITSVLTAVLIFMSAGTAMAAVWTDQADYSPGSIVTIHGNNSDNAGYQNGETVNVSVNGPYQYDSKCSGTVLNDAWSCQVTLSSDYTAEGNYTYTAVGQTSGVTQNGVFTDANNVKFIESGLPSGTSWSATFNRGTPSDTRSSTTNTIAYGNVQSGTYSYSILSPISGGTGTQYVASPYSGSITVQSSDVNQHITFTTQYQVTFAVNPTGTGTIIQTSGWYNSGSTTISANPNLNYKFQSWTADPTISIADPSSSSTTATINGPGTITANFVLADITPPTTTINLNPSTPNGNNGWYTMDVHVTVSAMDNTGGSGVAETRCVLDPASPPATFDDISAGCAYTGAGADVATEGQHIVYAASKDNTGNKETPTSKSFKLDKTGPSANLAVTAGTLGDNGWYTSDVTVHTSGSDDISGIATCSADQYQIDETTGTVFNGQCTNNAGLSTNAEPLTIKLDKTGPTAALSITAGTAGDNGWYTSDVTVSTSGTDSISNHVTCTADQFQTTETTGTVFNGQCTNDAGLSTNAAPLMVKLDKTGPSANLAVTAGTAGSNGWYTSDVTVHTSGSDDISGIATCSADQYQTDETTGTVFNGACTNNAGLSTNAEPLTVKLDKTGPTAALSITAGTLGDNGWYTSDVTVHTSGSDDISSPVTCTDDKSLTTETTGTEVKGACTNDAGLTTNAAPLTIKIDKTTPTISVTGFNNGDIFYTGNTLPTIGCSDPADSISGIASSSGPTISAGGLNANGVGSVTYKCTATDKAGNDGSDERTYSVRYGGVSGILQPINPDGTSLFKRGGGVPVKFQLAGDEFSGFNTASWTLKRIQVGCVSGEGTTLEDVGSVTPSQVFRYDATADQYIYNADFRTTQVGTCWKVVVTLDDGAPPMTSAVFRLSK